MGKTTTLEERVLICELSKAGHTGREIAEQMGWSKWTIRKWRRRGREGRKALASNMGRPATGVLSSFPTSIRETLKDWREAHPGWGPKTLRAELEADERFKGRKLPCVRSIAAFLKQEELTRSYERHSELPETTQATTVKEPHQVWEMDARGHELIPDVGVVTLINLNDRFSRLRLLSYPCLLGQERWTRAPTTEDYQIALRLAFTDWGLPKTIQVDHDGVFYDNGTKSPFPTWIHRWLIALYLSVQDGCPGHLADLRSQEPALELCSRGRPSDQGLTENSHQLWDRQVLQGQTFTDWDNLYHALRQRRDFLNTRLPCASLNEVPPLVAYPQAETSGRLYRPEWERDLLDLERVHDYLAQGRWFRKAGKDGNTSIGGQYYLLGCKWEEQQVEITFDPSDQELVFLAEDGERKQRHTIKGLTKEALMGELGPLVNLPAFQLALPTSRESWRAVRLCCTLGAPVLDRQVQGMTKLHFAGPRTKGFPKDKKVVGYAGLGGRVHDSGKTHKGGGITKQGRRDLRSALIEAAWSAVRYSIYWQGVFDKLSARIGREKAIVAVARRLLVTVWHVLTKKEADHHANPEKVAAKLMSWSWKLDDELRGGLSTPQFVRCQLLRLDLGHDIDSFKYGCKRIIAPAKDVLTLRPELRQLIAKRERTL